MGDGLSFPLPASFLMGLPIVRDNRTFWTRFSLSLGLLPPGDPSLFPRLGILPGVSEVMEEEEWYGFRRPRSLSSNPHVFIYKLCDLKQVTEPPGASVCPSAWW